MAETQRKRGVQASRAKLTRALNEAGLSSQVALAERIADLEQLASPPKDMVNRAFREQPVEIRSLDRIARALDVQAHTLYKSAAEPSDTPNPEPQLAARRSNRIYGLAAAIIIVLLVAGYTLLNGIDTDAPSGAGETLDLGAAKVGLLPIEHPLAADLTQAVRTRLKSEFDLASTTAAASVKNQDLADFARTLRLDASLKIELYAKRRLVGIRVFAFHQGIRQQIWAESLPQAALSGQLHDVAARVVRQVKRLFTQANQRDPFPLAPVQEDYLLGEYYLDEPSSELNIKRAESRFEAALRQFPNYAKAHAGLCQALLEAHWMLEEERMLQDARQACGQALKLDSHDPVVRIAHAHFLRRTGRRDEALKLYADLAKQHENYPSIYAGLSASLLDEYRELGNNEILQRAKAAARRAAELDKEIWKPLFNLGLMEWFDGNAEAAIAANEAGLLRHENEKLLANLGTLSACMGDFGKAQSAFVRAQELAPESYVGDEFMGMLHYLQGNYAHSIRLREQAIASIGEGEPEMHEMWGQLADAYRHSGAAKLALDAYRQAVEIAERDHVRGALPIADEAARAYYYLAMQHLDPNSVDPGVIADIRASLGRISEQQVETTAHRRLAQAWILVGQTHNARRSLEKATVQCPGYRRAAEFAVVVEAEPES